MPVETREEDEEFKNAVDLLFEELERDEPNHFAVRQYKKSSWLQERQQKVF